MEKQSAKKPTPRPRGTGYLKEMSKDLWVARVCLGRDSSGNRSVVNKTVHGSRKDAQDWINEQMAKKGTGAICKTKVTLSEFLKTWLKTTAKPRVSEATFRGYEWQLNRFIDGPLGSVKLARLRPESIHQLYSTLSPSTARHAHAPLRSALLQAVKWGLIPSNPCDAVDLPRHKAREIQALTRDEASRLMEVERFIRKKDDRRVVVENRYRVLFAFLLTTGARPSEAFGLKLSDIDFETGRVTIQRTLQWHTKKQGRGWYFEETKTKMSRRAVPLPAGLVQQLREHRANQAEALLKLGIRTDLLFATSEGTPILRRNLVKRYFKPVLKEAKLPAEFSLYGLRHTCATLLLKAGIHPKIVAERLGHASVRITLDTYSHVIPGMQEGATAQLERMLYG